MLQQAGELIRDKQAKVNKEKHDRQQSAINLQPVVRLMEELVHLLAAPQPPGYAPTTAAHQHLPYSTKQQLFTSAPASSQQHLPHSSESQPFPAAPASPQQHLSHSSEPQPLTSAPASSQQHLPHSSEPQPSTSAPASSQQHLLHSLDLFMPAPATPQQLHSLGQALHGMATARKAVSAIVHFDHHSQARPLVKWLEASMCVT
jgi:hypothetical protein